MKEAFQFASALRHIRDDAKISPFMPVNASSMAVEGPFASKSLKSQFRLADKLNAGIVIVFGDEELSRGMISIRDMRSKTQKEIPLKDISSALLP
jgi:histidyl-tRNA synthetase